MSFSWIGLCLAGGFAQSNFSQRAKPALLWFRLCRLARESHRAGQEAGAGAAAPKQRTSRPQLAHWPRPVPRGPWPLPPMSDAWNLPVANWPTVSCRVDP